MFTDTKFEHPSNVDYPNLWTLLSISPKEVSFTQFLNILLVNNVRSLFSSIDVKLEQFSNSLVLNEETSYMSIDKRLEQSLNVLPPNCFAFGRSIVLKLIQPLNVPNGIDDSLQLYTLVNREHP